MVGLSLVLGLSALVAAQQARAADDLDAFRAQRELASQFAAKKTAQAARLGPARSRVAAHLRLSDDAGSPAETLHQGQRWSVEAELSDAAEARKTSHPSQTTQATRLAPVRFQFEVVQVGADGLATVVVTDPQQKQTRLVLDGLRRVVRAESLSAAAGLDLFPMSVPPFDEDSAQVSGDTVEYTGQDAFAREVKVRWKTGDPWPLSIEGPMGVARLVPGVTR